MKNVEDGNSVTDEVAADDVITMDELPAEPVRKRHWGRWIVALMILMVAVGAGLAVVLNREWIIDWWRGTNYAPSNEMGIIRDKLQLTERGKFLFNASQPVLSDSGEFNAHCRTSEDAEVAVLGCYTERDIYVYDIKDEELNGIRELTAAHELLHAVWARMSEDERLALVTALTQTFESNQELLGSELETYDTSEKQEELYVRAGTEVKNLPTELEKHYAEIFMNQDGVVDFYESYIAVFREIEAEMEGLKVEMADIQTEIDNLTVEYERWAKQLDADIISFNSCAQVAGCFKSQEEFDSRRAALVNEQVTLNEMYTRINGLVDEYNDRVERYNADVIHGEKLNRAINSNKRLEEIRKE